MSFPFYKILFYPLNTYIKKTRKETDSLIKNKKTYISQTSQERASSFTSQGSITLETALALPLFVFAILCCVYLFEVMMTQTVMKQALCAAGKELVKESSVTAMLLPDRVEHEMIDYIGEERIARSHIAHGKEGIDCGGSSTYGTTTIMELVVKYDIEIPVPFFSIPIIRKEEKIRVKGFTGYEGSSLWDIDEGYVYVAETGMVYHKDPKCTYLDLSIRSAEKEAVKDVFSPCEKCDNHSAGDTVYVTDTGEKYHTKIDCSSLKRTVYKVKISEVYGRGGCSRCVN